MMRLKSLFVLLTALILGGNVLAQGHNFTGKDPLTTEAEFSLTLSKTSDFCVGDVIKACFKGHINTDGWHLYSSRDDGNISYNPTMLEVFPEESSGIELSGKMTEDKKPREKEDELMGGTIRDFAEHEVTFCQDLKITATNVNLVSELAAQTCTDAGMCKFLRLPFEWKFTAKACGGGAPSNTDSGADTPQEGGDEQPEESGNDPEEEGAAFNPGAAADFVAYDPGQSLQDNIAAQTRQLAGEIDSKLADASPGLVPFYTPGEAISYSAVAQKPALLYFRSTTGANAGKMETGVLGNAKINQFLRENFVIAEIIADSKLPLESPLKLPNGKAVRQVGKWFQAYQQEKFGTVSQPYFAIVDTSGARLGEGLGYETDPAAFQAFLEGGLTAFNAQYGISAEKNPEQDLAYGIVGQREKGILGLEGVAEAEEDCSSGALVSTFFLAFLVGLGAILTPCVFPMIPLTVSFFVKQGEEKASGIRGAVTYAASIIFIYGGLGLLISVLFGPSALYTLGSHPIPNFIFFVLFLVFAISFLGAFDITLPSSWSTAMNTKAGAGGILGPFFMALTLVIVSFSCTGPLLGAAVVGSTQGAACAWKPFMAMTGFGVAFGIPFGLLALFPSLLSKLPQAGGWMNTIKVVFGFLELALCMKFLSNVDLALHWNILDRQVFLGIWIVIFFLLGIYFLGKLPLPHDDKKDRTSVSGLLLGVATFSFAMYLFPGLWGAPLSALEGLIPPANTSVGVKLLPHQVADFDNSLNGQICEQDRKYASIYEDREAHGFCMFYDLDQAIEFAQEVNKPIFIDFTGHSCANCRKMENDVWPVNKVMETLKDEYVMVSLYADETERLEAPLVGSSGRKLRKIGDWVQDYQSTYYKTIAQPYYALVDFDESAMVMPVGYTPDSEEFHAYLLSGIEVFQERHNIAE